MFLSTKNYDPKKFLGSFEQGTKAISAASSAPSLTFFSMNDS